MSAHFTDPMTGKPVQTKGVTAFPSADTMTYDEFSSGQDGKPVKNLHIFAEPGGHHPKIDRQRLFDLLSLFLRQARSPWYDRAQQFTPSVYQASLLLECRCTLRTPDPTSSSAVSNRFDHARDPRKSSSREPDWVLARHRSN
jgi:hypothetical protein